MVTTPSDLSGHVERNLREPAPVEGDPQPKRLAWPIPEGALRLSVIRTTIYKLAAEGDLRLIKILGHTLIPDSEIVRLVEGH